MLRRTGKGPAGAREPDNKGGHGDCEATGMTELSDLYNDRIIEVFGSAPAA